MTGLRRPTGRTIKAPPRSAVSARCAGGGAQEEAAVGVRRHKQTVDQVRNERGDG